jgi:hypothetical protein
MPERTRTTRGLTSRERFRGVRAVRSGIAIANRPRANVIGRVYPKKKLLGMGVLG